MGDECYYIYEYTSGKDFSFSSTNSLISNLKKKPSTANANERYYKAGAIRRCAADLRTVMREDWLKSATLVPVPCSKAGNHPDFDNRIEQICRQILPGLDVRTLVAQRDSTVASHEVGDGERVTVEELIELYEIDDLKCQPAPTTIGIFDDVLTAGTHYRAMHTVLAERFPLAKIVGIFVARRVFPTAFENFGV